MRVFIHTFSEQCKSHSSLLSLLIHCSCTKRDSTIRAQWESLTRAKVQILSLLSSSSTNNLDGAGRPTAGVKLAAIKFAQRVVLTQTRGVSDPRVSRYRRFYVPINSSPAVYYYIINDYKPAASKQVRYITLTSSDRTPVPKFNAIGSRGE